MLPVQKFDWWEEIVSRLSCEPLWRLAAELELDKVEVEPTGHPERLRDRFNAELVAIGTDEANLSGPDAVVDPVLVTLRGCYDVSLLCKGGCLLNYVRAKPRRIPQESGRSS